MASFVARLEFQSEKNPSTASSKSSRFKRNPEKVRMRFHRWVSCTPGLSVTTFYTFQREFSRPRGDEKHKSFLSIDLRAS